jgi:PhzF family phenazine biosynthesis protein
MASINYHHVDVFSSRPYSGNSLAVVLNTQTLSESQMLDITRELRHFESIFLSATSDRTTVQARVFDLFEELPFAGHPIIGAAAVLHSLSQSRDAETWTFQVWGRSVSITTHPNESGFFGLIDQGAPKFLREIVNLDEIAPALNLKHEDLHSHLPAQVVSTGLKYLIIPVRPGALDRARVRNDLTMMLTDVGAQFAVLFDEATLEMRHWNNDGVMEDVATGSAAGCIGAYRLRHKLTEGNRAFLLQQGRFVGRPSLLRVLPEGASSDIRTVKVGGDVVLVGRGTLDALPSLRDAAGEIPARDHD